MFVPLEVRQSCVSVFLFAVNVVDTCKDLWHVVLTNFGIFRTSVGSLKSAKWLLRSELLGVLVNTFWLGQNSHRLIFCCWFCICIFVFISLGGMYQVVMGVFSEHPVKICAPLFSLFWISLTHWQTHSRKPRPAGLLNIYVVLSVSFIVSPPLPCQAL